MNFKPGDMYELLGSGPTDRATWIGLYHFVVTQQKAMYFSDNYGWGTYSTEYLKVYVQNKVVRKVA